MARVRLIIAVLATVLFVSSTAARATSVVHLDDPTLVALSDRIVQGTVTGVRSEWTPARTQIHTTVTIDVSRAIKGNVRVGDRVTFTILGGQVGNDVMELVGGPSFTLGQEVIVFLDATAPRLMPITGLFQGKLTIDTDLASGRRTVRERGETATAFVDRIRSLVASQADGDE